MTEIGFDPDPVYLVVEFVQRNQSALQSRTLSPKSSLAAFLNSYCFYAPLN